MVNCYAWYTASERRGTSPLAPLQRGERARRSVGKTDRTQISQMARITAFVIPNTVRNPAE